MTTRSGHRPRVNACTLLDKRLEAGLTQRDLATIAGIDSSTISRLESGDRSWAYPRITKALAAALGMTVAQLTGPELVGAISGPECAS